MPIGGLISSAIAIATSPLALVGGAGAAPAPGAPGVPGPAPAGPGGALTTITDLPGQILNPITNVVGGTLAAAVAVPLTIASAAFDVAGGIISVFGPSGEQQVDLTGFGGGNGRFSKRTIVQTLDITTGRITSKVMEGAPHMMNKDLRAAKKVFRLAAKLHAKMPRRTVKESETTKLKNAAVQAAMKNVTCPPKCE